MRDDTDTITLTFSYDRPLWRRAMSGWWRSVVPPDPFVKRAIFWAIVWFLIGILTLILSALDIAPSYVFADALPDETTPSEFRTRINAWHVQY